MVDSQIIRNWLDKADDDLAFAKASLQENFEFYPQICFYLGTRYPDFIISIDKLDAEKALGAAEEISNSVKSKLSEKIPQTDIPDILKN